RSLLSCPTRRSSDLKRLRSSAGEGMAGITSALRAASMRIALEPRMLFDGAAAVSADAAPAETETASPVHEPSISGDARASMRQGGSLWFDGLAGHGHAAPVQIADPDDAPGDLYQVKLWVSTGGATLAEVPGAELRYNGQDWVELTGSLDQVNEALAGLRIDPDDGFDGKASLGIQVNDPDGHCVERWITICVIDGNDPPVAGDDLREFSLGTVAIGGNVITGGKPGETPDHDPDGDPLRLTGIVAGNAATVAPGGLDDALFGLWGTLEIDCEGNYTYRPDGRLADLAPGEVRSDVFTYLIEDPEGATDTATLTFVVRGVDPCPEPGSPPVAVAHFRRVVAGGVRGAGQAVRGSGLGARAAGAAGGGRLAGRGVPAGSEGWLLLGGVGAAVAGGS